MSEKDCASSWSLADAEGSLLSQLSPLEISETRTLLIDRMTAGKLTTVLQSDRGLMLHLVTNRRRMMVMLMEADGSAGHAIDDGAQGMSSGYLLENGQEDEYADRDTLTVPDALCMIEWILTHGAAPESGWSVDVLG